MRCWLYTLLLCLGCGHERPPLMAVGGHGETVFAHDTFFDAAFERAVREALGRPDGELTDAALAGLQMLDAGGYEIADVRGIGRMSALQTLLLGDNDSSISDD